MLKVLLAGGLLGPGTVGKAGAIMLGVNVVSATGLMVVFGNT
jgi:hypothetical protein